MCKLIITVGAQRGRRLPQGHGLLTLEAALIKKKMGAEEFREESRASSTQGKNKDYGRSLTFSVASQGGLTSPSLPAVLQQVQAESDPPDHASTRAALPAQSKSGTSHLVLTLASAH